MSASIDEQALAQLFVEARSIQSFTDAPVSDETLRRLYDLLRLTPTGFNCQPARFVFVRSPAGKEAVTVV